MSSGKPRFQGQRVKLGEICEIQSGGTPKRSVREYWDNGTIPWVKISDIKSKLISSTDERITEEGLQNSSAKLFDKGTILYSIFASIGEVGILNIPAATNQAIAGIRIKGDYSEYVLCDYLYHWLKSRESLSKNAGRGVAQSNINLSILKSMEIMVPPVNVQRLISSQFEKIAHLLNGFHLQLSKLDDLVKSRFLEMFGGEKYTGHYMGELVSHIVAGTNVGGKQRLIEDGEYAVLKISSVTSGFFNSSEYKVVDDVSGIKMIHPRKGDLLFSRANTSEMVGATAIVDADYDNLFLPDKLWRLDPSDSVNTVFLKCLLSSSSVRAEMSKVATGSSGSMQNISMGKFKKLSAVLPPLSLQREFADFVAQVDKSGFAARQSIEKLQMLYDSLAQEYFG